MRTLLRRVVPAVALCAALGAATPAWAHPAPFSYLDIVFKDGGSIEGSLVIHVIDAAHDLGITPFERLMDTPDRWEDSRDRPHRCPAEALHDGVSMVMDALRT